MNTLDKESTTSDNARTLASSPVAIKSSLPPAMRRSGIVAYSVASSSSSLRTNIEETLRSEEAARTRGFGRVMAVLTGVALVLLPFIEGSSLLALPAAAALLALGGTGAWVWLWGASEQRYSFSVFRRFAWIAVVASAIILLHLGVFSPTPVGVTLGVAFFCLTDNRRLAIALAAAVSAIYLLSAGLIVFGIMPDPGVISPAGSPLGARVFMMVMVPVAYAVTCYQALLSRRTTREALEKAQAALVEANRRAAQRDEANLNLEQLVRAAAGREGRYSGQRVGDYELCEVIGRGGMGEVYAANHVVTGEPVAVKLLNAASQREAHIIERFWREVEVTSRLQVPNVVRALGFGQTPDGSPFIAMELLRGQDLSSKLRQVQRLELAECVQLAEEVGAGVDAAHRAGIVHRDIKPQNLFRVENDGVCWKVLDFGVSKLAGSSNTLTRLAVVGTPGYMSPEQAESLAAGPRSDVFSLGAVLYRALTGRPPFSGPDTPQILFQIVHRMPPRPTLIVPALPADVDAVLAIALAKDPSARFASGRELSDALRAAAAGELAPALRARGEALIDKQPWGVRT